MTAQVWGRSASGWVRQWALWTAPVALIWWVAGTVTAATGVAATGLAGTVLTRADLATWAVLLGCGVVSVEVIRRVGQPAGVAKDLLSVWALPVAFLLPPVFVVLFSVPLTVLRQVRVSRALAHRRVFSAAAIALADWVVSVAFHGVARWCAAHVAGGVQPERSVLVVAALGCAALGCAVNVVLIGTAVRLAAPETTWRELVIDREQRVIDVTEICLGAVVAGCWLTAPLLVLPMLVPVVLVQRSLSHAQLRAAARLDAKTGLLNAKAWQEEADLQISRALRESRVLAVLIADIDHFKRVNDAHGHLVGDAALLGAVTALRSGLRPYDQLGRFGGEEFTVVLPGTDGAEATGVAERLRRAVAASPVVFGDVTVDLSISVGVAVLGEHGHDLTDLLTAADHALYRAKQAGRNQVAVAG